VNYLPAQEFLRLSFVKGVAAAQPNEREVPLLFIEIGYVHLDRMISR
jgi:hypothetical protein